jgi:hypothetical protein
MRRGFNSQLTINKWSDSYNFNDRFKSPFAIWFKSQMGRLEFKRRDLINHGINSSQLTKWLQCKKAPHIHNIAKIIKAISKQTNADYQSLMNDCLYKIGFYK